ncbi:MAG: hypothetical protein NTW86_23725 [Candidatus Sumerlaeota bacterium]|nr:hypothetical protein [Candidatus Sumerlaeota bacterium]
MAAERFRTFLRAYRVEVLLFFAFWISFACFWHVRPGWNVNSRIGLTFALIDRGTFSIDAYHEYPPTATEDKAFYEGHFYCDKSPALSLLAAPFYAAITPFVGDLDSPAKVDFARQWCTVWTVGLLGALGAALFYRLMRRFGASGEEALPLTLFLVYGTNLGGYTSLFFPYLPATACLIGAYVLLSSAAEATRGRAAAIGLLISMAGFFEYTFDLAAGILLALALVRLRPRRLFGWTILGALPPALALLAYNRLLFGDFGGPYLHEAAPRFREGMAQGFMGITRPNLSALFYITVHPFRGLFFYSPILYVFILGSLWIGRLERKGADLAAGWAALGGYLLFNSSYYMWWGGWSMGPRHLIPMLPFLFLPILAAMRRGPRMRNLVLLAGCVSVLLNVPAIVVDPQIPPLGIDEAALYNPPFPPANLPSTWLTGVIPAFLRGQVATNPFRFLPGLASLIPLLALWVAVIWRAWRWEHPEE